MRRLRIASPGLLPGGARCLINVATSRHVRRQQKRERPMSRASRQELVEAVCQRMLPSRRTHARKRSHPRRRQPTLSPPRSPLGRRGSTRSVGVATCPAGTCPAASPRAPPRIRSVSIRCSAPSVGGGRERRPFVGNDHPSGGVHLGRAKTKRARGGEPSLRHGRARPNQRHCRRFPTTRNVEVPGTEPPTPRCREAWAFSHTPNEGRGAARSAIPRR